VFALFVLDDVRNLPLSPFSRNPAIVADQTVPEFQHRPICLNTKSDAD